MDHELLKRLLDFLAAQGAQLNRWEAKRLSLGLDATEAQSWHIKDRGFVDYLIERCLHKDHSFWNLSEKIWQHVFQYGPLMEPFLHPPFELWSQWKKELCQDLKLLIVQESGSKRLTHLSPTQLAEWIVQVAKKSHASSQILQVISPKQREQWQYVLHGKALVSKSEEISNPTSSFISHLRSVHAELVDLASKLDWIELTEHQLDLLYRLRARQQIEKLVQKFYQESHPSSENKE